MKNYISTIFFIHFLILSVNAFYHHREYEETNERYRPQFRRANFDMNRNNFLSKMMGIIIDPNRVNMKENTFVHNRERIREVDTEEPSEYSMSMDNDEQNMIQDWANEALNYY